MKKTVKFTENIPVKGEYDIIVIGGGVGGIASAVAAARHGAKVLLLEKSVNLGGLATNGLVNYFVPLCNGRGKQIITGMAEEFLKLSIKYGFDTLPPDWKNGEPQYPTEERYATNFSAPIFSLALAELLDKEKVDILYDTVFSRPVLTAENIVESIITESKSGRECYSAKLFVDATGDADLLFRAGAPTVCGKSYFTYYAFEQDMKSLANAVNSKDMAKASHWIMGGTANLYGKNRLDGDREYDGTTNADITEYMLKNQLLVLEKLKNDDRKTRDIVCLPTLPQLRTTRRLDGNYTLTEKDVFMHQTDSVGAICDFDRRDYLYEVPFGTLINNVIPNVATVGRSASASGYAWDVLRVIPPAILSGQAVGVAAAQNVKSGKNFTETNISELQTLLKNDGVTIHFDDALVPENACDVGQNTNSEKI